MKHRNRHVLVGTGLLLILGIPAAHRQISPGTVFWVDRAVPTDIRHNPDTVITVPLRIVNGMLFVSATVAGHCGLWLLDTGGPMILVNREYLQPAVQGNGLDTVAGEYHEDSVLASGNFNGQHDWSSDSVPVQVGPLILQIKHKDGAAIATPMPRLLEKHWGAKPLGILGFAMVLKSYETIVDYTRQRLTLIPVDSAGQRLVTVSGYTAAAIVPLIRHATQGGWFVEASLGGVLDTLLIDTGEPFDKLNVATPPHLAGHLATTSRNVFDDLRQERVVTLDHLVFGGRSYNAVPFSITSERMDGFGTEFFSRVGAVGFNFRARQLIIYR